jgi:hypothetical protein
MEGKTMRHMLRTFEGKYIKGNGFKSIQAVKAQFRRAGHVPGTVADLSKIFNGENILYAWQCSCGATLRFEKVGKRFNRLTVIGG